MCGILGTTTGSYSDKQYYGVLTGLLLGLAVSNELESSTSSCEDANGKIYRKQDVAAHTTKETGIWVTYQGGVYDITNFIVNHPGGSIGKSR